MIKYLWMASEQWTIEWLYYHAEGASSKSLKIYYQHFIFVYCDVTSMICIFNIIWIIKGSMSIQFIGNPLYQLNIYNTKKNHIINCNHFSMNWLVAIIEPFCDRDTYMNHPLPFLSRTKKYSIAEFCCAIICNNVLSCTCNHHQFRITLAIALEKPYFREQWSLIDSTVYPHETEYSRKSNCN